MAFQNFSNSGSSSTSSLTLLFFGAVLGDVIFDLILVNNFDDLLVKRA